MSSRIHEPSGPAIQKLKCAKIAPFHSPGKKLTTFEPRSLRGPVISLATAIDFTAEFLRKWNTGVRPSAVFDRAAQAEENSLTDQWASTATRPIEMQTSAIDYLKKLAILGSSGSLPQIPLGGG